MREVEQVVVWMLCDLRVGYHLLIRVVSVRSYRNDGDYVLRRCLQYSQRVLMGCVKRIH